MLSLGKTRICQPEEIARLARILLDSRLSIDCDPPTAASRNQRLIEEPANHRNLTGASPGLMFECVMD